MGEPAGTSPEIITRTLRGLVRDPEAAVIVTGDDGIFRRLASDIDLPLPFTFYAESHDELSKAEEEGERLIFYRSSSIDLRSFSYGAVSAQTGKASYEALHCAVDIIQNGLGHSLVTSPISSTALSMAGYREQSLFELLGLFASASWTMNMIEAGKMNIFGLTHRRSLRSAVEAVTRENLISALIRIDSLRVSPYFDGSKPIAVASLNPMRADGTWTGDEEEKVIIPAIETLRALGAPVIGPIPSDSVYERAVSGEFSSVLTMTAGEGFAAAAAAPGRAVMLTWGLPFMRVGVMGDAGLPLAGKGIASIEKMQAALSEALRLRDVSLMA